MTSSIDTDESSTSSSMPDSSTESHSPQALLKAVLPREIFLHKTPTTLSFLRRTLAKARAQRSSSCLPKIKGNLCAFTSNNSNSIFRFDTDSFAIIVDTGASAAFTHCLQDFSSFTPYTSKVAGLGTLNIKGIGTVEYPIINDKGDRVILKIKNAYYVPALNSRLVSPQQICEQSTLPCLFEGNQDHFKLRWERHSKTLSYDKTNNLPTLYTASGMSVGTTLAAQLASKPLSGTCCFKVQRTVPQYNFNPSLEDEASDAEVDTRDLPAAPPKSIKITCSSTDCADCKIINDVEKASEAIDVNALNNMSAHQRELLHLHERFGHLNFKALQKLCSHKILPYHLRNITPPVCVACQLGKQHKIKRNKFNKIVSTDIKNVGDLVHIDQAESSTPGRPMTLSGHNNQEKVTCFTLFVDSISKKIHVHFQTSTNAAQTLQGKHRFERQAQQFDVKIKNFRADNGIFRSKEFRDDLEIHEQDVTYCGVGAHHQNGVAERHIRIIVERARTALLHASTKWPDMIDPELWTYAVNYAVHQWNLTPREDLKFLSPEEVFSGTTSRTLPDLSRSSGPTDSKVTSLARTFQTFGCPVFVLDSALQDGKSLPKFDPRSRTGIFLGHSSEHAGSVSLVLNPKSGRISNQFHTIFDNNFETVSPDTRSKKLAIWENISKRITIKQEPKVSFTPEPFEEPQLPTESIDPSHTSLTSLSSLSKSSEGDIPSSEGDIPSSEGDVISSEGDSLADESTVDLRTLASTRGDNIQCTTTPAPLIGDSSRATQATGTRRSKRSKKKSVRLRRAEQESIKSSMYALAASLHKPHLGRRRPTFQQQIDRLLDLSALSNGEVNDLHPLAFAASANPNILTHAQAKRASDYDKFQIAMQDEIKNMMKKKIFEVVPRTIVPRQQRVLRAVWSHRRKTTPSGEIYRHRSRLCVDGSQQQHGIDFTDTYSPVVNWTTVRILMILSKVYKLKMRQVDYVQAFPQANLADGELVFMEIPDGFSLDGNKTDYCLKLLKNVYGLRQAAFNWMNLLNAGLQKLGFKQSPNDPCLFTKKDIICVVYVDDTIFFSRDEKVINKTISALKALDFELTDEGDVDAFLGIQVDHHKDGSLTMSQPHLTERFLELVGLNKDSKQHKTPAVSPPLHAHENGAPRDEKWSYRSAIGMLSYISRNTRPDIEYAVHQCARFQMNPKRAHERAVKRIGRYLIGTRDKGITFKPDPAALDHLECFVDADFAGNYCKEIQHDPVSVKSRTGCVIKYAGCPIHWFSRLQSEIALSTTEAEYIALSIAARELLPMRELLSEITNLLHITTTAPKIHCTIFEDNVGAETLAKAPKMNPRTKHIAIKYHFFKESVKKNILKIARVETSKQQADIFTKPVTFTILEPLRKEIMGWLSLFKPKAKIEENDYANLCFLANILTLADC